MEKRTSKEPSDEIMEIDLVTERTQQEKKRKRKGVGKQRKRQKKAVETTSAEQTSSSVLIEEQKVDLNDTEWWVNFVILPEFQKQLDFALKKRIQSFCIKMPLPEQIFCQMFWEPLKELEKGKVKFKVDELGRCVRIFSVDGLKQLDCCFLNSTDWRTKKIVSQSSRGNLFSDGEVNIVLHRWVESDVIQTDDRMIKRDDKLSLKFTKKTSQFECCGRIEVTRKK